MLRQGWTHAGFFQSTSTMLSTPLVRAFTRTTLCCCCMTCRNLDSCQKNKHAPWYTHVMFSTPWFKSIIQGKLSYLFIARFLDVKLHSIWAAKYKKYISMHFKSPPSVPERGILLYQQENMWMRRNVLVSRGSSDFFTLVFRACRKHCNSRASIASVKSGMILVTSFALYRLHICNIRTLHFQLKPHIINICSQS